MPLPINLTTRGGVLALPGIAPSTASTASKLLSQNHTANHIFFNASGFHNHIPHHLLALFDLGASTSLLTTSFDRESTYQRPIHLSTTPTLPLDLNPTNWSSYLGNEAHYISFLTYFRTEIEKRGYEDVILSTLFKTLESGDNMLARLFGGFLHPFISLGYGLEFQLPAMVAEGLAMAAVQEVWLSEAFLKVDELASQSADPGTKTMVELLGEIRACKKLATAAEWNDANKVEGVLQRAPEELLAVLKQYKVPIDQLERKAAEAFNAAAFYTAAAQRPDKEIRMDFYFMHALNSSIFLPTLLSLPWLPAASKVQILEWKGRLDLTLYASRRAPELHLRDITSYTPKEPSPTNAWLNVFDRAMRMEEEGHTVKFIRACAYGEKVCARYQDEEGFMVAADMWIRIAQMCIDSVEEKGVRWARSVGFDEAWVEYGPRVKRGEGL